MRLAVPSEQSLCAASARLKQAYGLEAMSPLNPFLPVERMRAAAARRRRESSPATGPEPAAGPCLADGKAGGGEIEKK